MPTIAVADEALRDEETPVRITGLDPETRVELRARSDGWFADGCESRATFEADADGVVDTAAQAPVDGSDDGVAPMGWLRSMAPEGDGGFPEGDRDPISVTVEARVDGESVASATTVRQPTVPGVEHRQVGNEAVDDEERGDEERGDEDRGDEGRGDNAVGDDVVGDLFLPPDDGPHPGVLVLHGSGGTPSRGVASLLASHGFAAFAVQYFGEPDPVPDDLLEVPVEYFDDAARWLRDRDAVVDGPLGLYGTSKGAEAALVVAAQFDWPDAVVAVAPSAYRWQGLEESFQTEASSWTLDGEGLPYLPFRAPPGSDAEGNVVLRDVYANSLSRVPDERVEAARIPADEIDADVLLVAGGDDGMWPSAEYARELGDRLADREGAGSEAAETEVVTVDDAGHGISPPYRPTAGTTVVEGTVLGGTPAGNGRVVADYWPRALDFLAGISPTG